MRGLTKHELLTFLEVSPCCFCLKEWKSGAYSDEDAVGSKKQIKSKRSSSKKKLLHYRTYWRTAFKTDPSSYSRLTCRSPISPVINTQPTRSSRSKKHLHCSPVRLADPGSKLFAYERLRTKDFHVPSFRLISTKRYIPSSRSTDYQIESYFEYLKQFCESEVKRLSDKSVQCNFDDLYFLEERPRVNINSKCDFKTLDETYKELQKAMKDIDDLSLWKSA